MITINFSATVGLGLRRRVIMPALVLQDRPVLIVSPARAMLESNWPDIPNENKVTLQRFLLMMQSRSIDPGVLVVFEEMRPTGWKMVDPWLKALDNEVWTINRSL